MIRMITIPCLLIAGAGALGAQVPDAVWATDSTAPCAGLTVGWRVDAARLQALVGTHGTVATTPDGRGLVLLFVTFARDP
jgi:hypothetical protein